MCTFATITMAAAGLITAAASAYSASTEKAAAKYQSELYVKDAEKAKSDAAYERQTGIEDARNKRLQAILNMGEAKTTIASGNIATSSQTALNIIDDEKLNGELDALTTIRNSEKKAQDYLYQSDQYYAQAGLTSFKSKSQYTKTMLNTLSSFAKSEAELL